MIQVIFPNDAAESREFKRSPMATIETICQYLDQFAPPELAETWDNIGLLVGDRRAEIRRVMTCLTVTPESVAEAIEEQAGLIVSHHPLMFKAIQQITRDDPAGSMLLDLIANRIAVYSPHTSFDSTRGGINEQIAHQLGLKSIRPLKPLAPDQAELGAGRFGTLDPPVASSDLASQLKQQFQLDHLGIVQSNQQPIQIVAVGCGSGGSFLSAAAQQGSNALITGETNFHTCLEARALGVNLYLLGHYASERFAVENLANQLQEEFPELQIWASNQESDPLEFC